MKNIVFLIFAITPFFTNAQNGKLAIETNFLLRADSTYTPNLRLRYFLNENSAIRTNISYQYSDVTNEILETNGEGVGTLEHLNSLISISLGYEKLWTKDKFRPYLGIDFCFQSGKNEIYGNRTDSLSFIADFKFTSKTPISGFQTTLFSGVDVFIYDGLYFGTELGFRYSSLTYKRGEFTTEDASSSTAASTSIPLSEITYKNFGLTPVGLIRLGWNF